jgi:polyhydroxybutyrate depolymerase
MNHRVACEMSDRFTAVAPIAGSNQFSTNASCEPSSPISVLQIHGTGDTCWGYETSTAACADRDGLLKLGAIPSLEGWADRLGCDTTPTVRALPDKSADGMSADRLVYPNCDTGNQVEHIRIEGGGHVWPGGWAFSRQSGTATADFGAEIVWEFSARFKTTG